MAVPRIFFIEDLLYIERLGLPSQGTTIATGRIMRLKKIIRMT